MSFEDLALECVPLIFLVMFCLAAFAAWRGSRRHMQKYWVEPEDMLRTTGVLLAFREFIPGRHGTSETEATYAEYIDHKENHPRYCPYVEAEIDGRLEFHMANANCPNLSTEDIGKTVSIIYSTKRDLVVLVDEEGAVQRFQSQLKKGAARGTLVAFVLVVIGMFFAFVVPVLT